MGKIIVTGGAGFIGSHLVKHLVNQGRKVVVLDNFSTGTRKNLVKVLDRIQLVKVDLVDHHKVFKKTASLGKVDYVFHIAALPRIGRSVEFPIETHHANVTGTLAALEIARRLKVRKFLYTSSSSVYGIQRKQPLTEDLKPNPINPYAVQKLTGELYCKNYSEVFKIKTIVFRLFNVYGPKMGTDSNYKLVFSAWAGQKKAGLPLTIFGDGKQTRDFTHISDVVRGLVAGMEYKQKTPFEIFNLGAGRQVSVNYLASLFKHKVVYHPSRKHEEKFKEADLTKTRALLGWEPQVTIEEGVKELLE